MYLFDFVTDEHLNISGIENLESCFKIRHEIKLEFLKFVSPDVVKCLNILTKMLIG